ISMLADIQYKTGPPSVRSENGKLVGLVFVDVTTSDIDGYVRKASQHLSEHIQYRAGYYVECAGKLPYRQVAKGRLKIVVLLTRRSNGMRGTADSANNHDRLRDPIRFAANHVVPHPASRRRCDETHRHADDRRHHYVGNS